MNVPVDNEVSQPGDAAVAGTVVQDEAAAEEPAATEATESAATEPVEQPTAPGLAGRATGVRLGLAAFGLYLALWLAIWAWPLLIHPQWAQLGQAGMDPNFYVWGLRWWPYAIGHGLDPLFSNLVRAPAGVSLAWVTTVPPLAVLTWPITALFGPVVTFSLLVVASIPVSAWAAYLLCHRLTGRFWASLAGGAVYGFCAYQTSHLLEGQLNLSFGPLLPLIGYLIVVWWQGKLSNRTFGLVFGLTLAVQCYLFVETFADLTMLLPAGMAAGYLVARSEVRPKVIKLAGWCAAGYALAVLLAAPLLITAIRHIPHGFVRNPAGAGVDLVNLVIDRSGNLPAIGHFLGLGFLTPPHTAVWPRGGFVGALLLVVGVAAIALRWRDRLARLSAIMAGLVLLAAFGPEVLANGQRLITFPWARLWYLPIVRSSFAVRLMIFEFVALAVLTALWLAPRAAKPTETVEATETVSTSTRTRLAAGARWALAIAAIIGVFTTTPPFSLRNHQSLPAFITTGAYHRYIRPGTTLVIVSDHTGNAGLLWQAETGFYFKLAGGFLNEALRETAVPLPVSDLVTLHGRVVPRMVRRFNHYVRRAHITAIIVQLGSSPTWEVVLRKLGLRPQYADGVTIYRLPRRR